MPLRYVFDENLRGPLFRAMQRHNAQGNYPVDIVRVGDPPDLPLEIDDPALLRWAERERRILVTCDKSTMPAHLAAHLQAGQHCPGVFMLRPGRGLPSVVSFLMLAAYASEPAEWAGRIEYIPANDG